jgi:hypothetical protein
MLVSERRRVEEEWKVKCEEVERRAKEEIEK